MVAQGSLEISKAALGGQALDCARVTDASADSLNLYKVFAFFLQGKRAALQAF